MADVDGHGVRLGFGSTPAHPDLQNTINDFSDYTEHFPADLFRSLKLIEKLDAAYHDDADHVHELTTTYSLLPTLSAKERPEPIQLRKQISTALDHAIRSRHSALAEASRIYQVALRHKERITTIKRKLQAQPEPPSRDPTPPPAPVVSPHSARARRPTVEKTPRITLHVGQAATARPAHKSSQKHKSRRASTGGISRGVSVASDYDSAESESDIPAAGTQSGRNVKKIKLPKAQKVRIPKVKLPGSGTNVHSAVAGISTSNALAKLTPPPQDAKIGSKYRPWHKLTEYEMAVLRKSMKKNAIWTPSDTMIRRELVKHGRGHENYLRAKAEAAAKGEEFLDEDPADPMKAVLSPGEIRFQPTTEKEEELINRGMRLNEAKKEKKEKEKLEQIELARAEGRSIPEDVASSRRDRKGGRGVEHSDEDEAGSDADLDAREHAQRKANRKMEEASSSIMKVANNLKTILSPAPTTVQKKRERSSRKRKRDRASIGPVSAETDTIFGSVDETPGPKRIKITVPGVSQTPANGTTTEETPSEATEDVSMADTASGGPTTTVVTTTTSVPLAPAGSSTPPTKVPLTDRRTRSSTPAVEMSAVTPVETIKKPVPGPISTAASTRTRRGSLAKTSSPVSAIVKISDSVPGSPALSEPPLSAKSTGQHKSATPQPVTRPRSSRGASTAVAAAPPSAGKAASAEPPATKRESRELRDLRRGSNVSLPSTTLAAEAATSSRITRRGNKPPPGFVVEQEEGSGKGKVSRSQRKIGLRNNAGGKGLGGIATDRAGDMDELQDVAEETADAPATYCVCRDVDFGVMIACENLDYHDEWFHIECVGFNEQNYPRGRQKWYCPECQTMLHVDARGHKL